MSERQQQEQLELAPETEANELKQLRLSATFLTPFAVAPTQDNRVWLSNNHQTYIDVSPNKQGILTARNGKFIAFGLSQGAMIGFQGRAAGPTGSETREVHVFTADFQEYIEHRDKAFFRTRDHFSDYAEAKARDPSRSKK